MEYKGHSYHLKYQGSNFDSALELTWFLFLSALDFTKNNISSHPLDYKHDLNWYPDLRFVVFNTMRFEIFAEVKPLTKMQFEKDLILTKYKKNDSTTCILGSSCTDYQLLENSIELSGLFEANFTSNIDKWDECKIIAYNLGRKFGDNQTHNEEKLNFGKYKGYTLREVKEKDISYYNWFLETFD